MDYSKLYKDIFTPNEVTGTFWHDKHCNSPQVYRLENQSQRFYYTLDPIRIGTSITTWLKRVMPSPFFLEKWYRENTPEYLEAKLKYSSHYGTFQHVNTALLLTNGSVDLDKLKEGAEIYFDVNGLEPYDIELGTPEEWAERAVNDTLCVLSFIQEKEFKAIAVEWIGFHEATKQIPINFGCAIDLVGTMKYRNKDIYVIIDLKTGGLYDEQGYQMLGNQACWNQHNPDIKIERLYNLSPKQATSVKKYDLKERKIEDYKDKFLLYAQLASYENFTPKNFPISGVVTRDTDINNLFLSPTEYIRRKHEQK